MQQLHNIPNDKKVKGSIILAYCAFVQNSISLYCTYMTFWSPFPDFITEWLLIQSVVIRTVKKTSAPYSFIIL